MINNIQNSKYKELIRKVVNREIIAYAIAGVLTTAVNFSSYLLFYNLGLTELNANAIAWVIAVIFAYVMNKRTVFMLKSVSLSAEVIMVVKFFGARLITLGVEELGMYLFIYRFGFYHLAVKASLAVIVIILNYVLSKLYVFINKHEK